MHSKQYCRHRFSVDTETHRLKLGDFMGLNNIYIYIEVKQIMSEFNMIWLGTLEEVMLNLVP